MRLPIRLEGAGGGGEETKRMLTNLASTASSSSSLSLEGCANRRIKRKFEVRKRVKRNTKGEDSRRAVDLNHLIFEEPKAKYREEGT